MRLNEPASAASSRGPSSAARASSSPRPSRVDATERLRIWRESGSATSHASTRPAAIAAAPSAASRSLARPHPGRDLLGARRDANGAGDPLAVDDRHGHEKELLAERVAALASACRSGPGRARSGARAAPRSRSTAPRRARAGAVRENPALGVHDHDPPRAVPRALLDERHDSAVGAPAGRRARAGTRSATRAARIAASPRTAERKSDSARRSTVSASGITSASTTAVRT